MTDRDRLPLPSEDAGDLADAPSAGASDDPLVSTDEGVPYTPPTDRVITTPRTDEGGPDVAGAPRDDAGALEADRSYGAVADELPADDALLADVLAALRDSDVPAGDRIEVAVNGRTVTVRGEVESIEVGEEIAAIAAEVPGVEDVTDETSVAGL